jgi:hypothetical protein
VEVEERVARMAAMLKHLTTVMAMRNVKQVGPDTLCAVAVCSGWYGVICSVCLCCQRYSIWYDAAAMLALPLLEYCSPPCL